ncbi:hypothetical protein [Sulfuracidifex tepidarius]|uniref:Uncharacterized protein n=1 Tax=Sulfuracidifex tepidarius TaxID=1294262 RepID=A0A510E3K8_9CREN|nr:hypothetical protein [Sulfuracidifex tepidarius]BBG24346.1 hypothetical protein IC006_1656 [Sulfuracidifex tepidarius]BBG27103.1 hypothetical protein IC007_1633 [Sulfuracidifex tepidarius]
MLKYAEYTRHSLTEPILNVIVYKKVEDGKIIGAFRFLYYKNNIIILYEDDSYKGADLIEVSDASLNKLIESIRRFYDEENDDMSLIGEKALLDEVVRKIYPDEEE